MHRLVGMVAFVAGSMGWGGVALADRTALPGFSIDTPPGEVIQKPDERYDQGELTYGVTTGDDGHMLFSIAWEAGNLLNDAELRTLGKSLGADLGKKHRRTLTTVDGPGGVPARTVVLTTARGQLELSQVPCGNRRITLMSGGKPAVKAIHARLLASIACDPQPSQEADAGDLAVVLEMPGWFRTDSDPGNVVIGDGRSLVMLRTLVGGSPEDLADSTRSLAEAMGWTIELGDTDGDLTPLHGTVLGVKVQGFVRLMSCPTGSTAAIALTASRALATRVAAKLATYRCRKTDEPVQVWPTKPARRRRHR